MTPMTRDTVQEALYEHLDLLLQRARSGDYRYAKWPVQRGPNPARQRLAAEIRHTRNAIVEVRQMRHQPWPEWYSDPTKAAEVYALEAR